MRPASIILSIALLLAVSSLCSAIDHSNIDENRPLRLEDAYPIAHGEWVLEGGLGFSSERHKRDRWSFPVQILYGALPNLQVDLGTTFYTSPHSLDETRKSGDLSLGALYNFNQETMCLPAFAVKGSLNVPTGIDSAGVDFEITGLITKSFHRLSFHLNASYELIGGERARERGGRYKFAFGSSYPIGAVMHTRTLLLGDIFLEQSTGHGEKETLGLEIGLRHQLLERIILDIGVGSEVSGPEDRSRFFIRTGASFSF